MRKIIIVLSLFLITCSTSFAQTAEPAKKESHQKEKMYACKMCNITSDKPGNCSHCGMKMKKEKAKKYTCEMCRATSKKPGNCSHCKMKMTENENEKQHHDKHSNCKH